MNEAKDAQTKFVQGNIIDKDQPIKEQNQQLQQQQGVQQQKPIEESKQQDLTQSQLKQLLQQPPQQEEQKQEQITIKVQEQGEFTDLQKVFNEHDDIAKIYGSLFIKETIQEQAGKEQFAKSLEALRQAVYSAYAPKEQYPTQAQQQQDLTQAQQDQPQIQYKNKDLGKVEIGAQKTAQVDVQQDEQDKAKAQTVLAAMAQGLQARNLEKQMGVNAGDILCGPDVSTVLLSSGEIDGFWKRVQSLDKLDKDFVFKGATDDKIADEEGGRTEYMLSKLKEQSQSALFKSAQLDRNMLKKGGLLEKVLAQNNNKPISIFIVCHGSKISPDKSAGEVGKAEGDMQIALLKVYSKCTPGLERI